MDFIYVRAIACNIGEKDSPKTKIENPQVWAFVWPLLRGDEVRCVPHQSFDWWPRSMCLRSILHPCPRLVIRGCVYVFEHDQAHFARLYLLINSFLSSVDENIFLPLSISFDEFEFGLTMPRDCGIAHYGMLLFVDLNDDFVRRYERISVYKAFELWLLQYIEQQFLSIHPTRT